MENLFSNLRHNKIRLAFKKILFFGLGSFVFFGLFLASGGILELEVYAQCTEKQCSDSTTCSSVAASCLRSELYCDGACSCLISLDCIFDDGTCYNTGRSVYCSPEACCDYWESCNGCGGKCREYHNESCSGEPYQTSLCEAGLSCDSSTCHGTGDGDGYSYKACWASCCGEGGEVSDFNGLVRAEDTGSQRYSSPEVEVTSSPGNVEWQTDELGGHFDVKDISPGVAEVTLTQLASGYDNCSWYILDYATGSPTGETGDTCTASFSLPNGDWLRGVIFTMHKSQKWCAVTLSDYSFDKSETPMVAVWGRSFHATDDLVRLWVEKFPNSGLLDPVPQYKASGSTSWDNTSGWEDTYYLLNYISCLTRDNESCNDYGWISMKEAGDYCFHCDLEADPGKCSGNPECTYEGGDLNCDPWVSCSDEGDNVCFEVFNAPDCDSMAVSSSVCAGDVVWVLAQPSDEDGDNTINHVDFFYTDDRGDSYDYCGVPWGSIGSDFFADGGWSVDWDTTGLLGDYYVVANVTDDDGHWCTGNPSGVCDSGADTQCTDCRPTITIEGPTCTVSLSPSTLDFALGDPARTVFAIVDIPCGDNDDIAGMIFSDGGSTVIDITQPSGDLSEASNHKTIVTPTEIGTASISVNVQLNNGYICDCLNCTNVSVDAPGAWFQAKEGDVHAEEGIFNSDLPDTENFCLDGEGGTPGVASYNSGGIDIGSAPLSSTRWKANTSFSTEDFAFFYELMGEPTDNFTDLDDIVSGTTVYYSSSGVNIANNFPAPNRAIVLVNGSVDINTDIFVPVGSFLAIIASGNVDIDTGVSDIQGIFVTDGTFETGEIDAEGSELTAEGMFIAGRRIELGRKLQAGNIDTPGELFDYRPDFFFNAPPEILIPHYTWDELLPSD